MSFRHRAGSLSAPYLCAAGARCRLHGSGCNQTHVPTLLDCALRCFVSLNADSITTHAAALCRPATEPISHWRVEALLPKRSKPPLSPQVTSQTSPLPPSKCLSRHPKLLALSRDLGHQQAALVPRYSQLLKHNDPVPQTLRSTLTTVRGHGLSPSRSLQCVRSGCLSRGLCLQGALVPPTLI